MTKMNEQYPLLKNWPKEAGKPPSQKAFKLVHSHEWARPGSKEAVAVAMALRPQGTTQSQVIAVLGKPHRNKLAALESSHKAKLKKEGMNGLTVYKLEPNEAA